MALPPVPLRWIFRSRWAALAWAGGICWMAYEHAGGGKAAGGDTPTDAIQQAAETFS